MRENPSSIGDARVGCTGHLSSIPSPDALLILGVLAVVALPFLMAGLSTLP